MIGCCCWNIVIVNFCCYCNYCSVVVVVVVVVDGRIVNFAGYKMIMMVFINCNMRMIVVVVVY